MWKVIHLSVSITAEHPISTSKSPKLPVLGICICTFTVETWLCTQQLSWQQTNGPRLHTDQEGQKILQVSKRKLTILSNIQQFTSSHHFSEDKSWKRTVIIESPCASSNAFYMREPDLASRGWTVFASQQSPSVTVIHPSLLNTVSSSSDGGGTQLKRSEFESLIMWNEDRLCTTLSLAHFRSEVYPRNAPLYWYRQNAVEEIIT